MCYSKLKHLSKNVSMGIHTAAYAYNKVLPELSKHYDMSHVSAKLSNAYEGYKQLESRVEAGDQAVNQFARFIRPAFNPQF